MTGGRRGADALELRAIERGNGYINARLGGPASPNAHGLRPEWNGAGYYHAIKFLCLAPRGAL